MTTEAERIASKLSQPMIEMLRNGFYGEGSAGIIGTYRNPTRNALVRRGLVHDDNRWTALGREVVRVIDPRVKTLDELHTMALALNDPEPVAGVEGTSLGEMRRAFEITASGREKIAAAVERNAQRIKAAAQPEQTTGMATYGRAEQPGRRVVSRFGLRGHLVRRGDRTVTISVGGSPKEVSVQEYDEDWWPDTNPRGTVRITESVAQAAYAGFESGGVRGAVKAAFEAVGLQVTE